MSSILRIHRFVESANQAYDSATPQYLTADPHGLGVRQVDLPRAFSEADQKQNEQTWKIFQNSLVDALGQKKFDWICHRYRATINFTQALHSGQPLLPQHVELFSAGASQLLKSDIEKRFSHDTIGALSREQLGERMRIAQPFPIVGSYQDRLKITGSLSSLLARYFHDPFLMDKQKQLLLSNAEFLTFPAWLERMTKVLVSKELMEGQLIPAPGSDGRTDYYEVYRKIATGDGLVAYALKPAASDSTLKPLIAFRPSQWNLSNEDAIETYCNDVQPSIGDMGWKAAEEHFRTLMAADSGFRRNNEKITVSGYSLGGAHAQYFLAEHFNHVSHAVYYADPSVDDSIAEKCAETINQMPRRAEPLNIQIIRHEGDFCNYMGGKHIGWGVTHPDVNIQLMMIGHDDKEAQVFTLHSHRIFDNHVYPYQMQIHEDKEKLFDLLDNSKRGPEVVWYEKTRRLWGGVAFVSFTIIAKVIKAISSFFGLRILRSSKNPNLSN